MTQSRNQGQHVTHLPSLNYIGNTPSLKFAISGKPASIHTGGQNNHPNLVIGSSITPNRHAMNTIQKKRFNDELDAIPATQMSAGTNNGNVTQNMQSRDSHVASKGLGN